MTDTLLIAPADYTTLQGIQRLTATLNQVDEQVPEILDAACDVANTLLAGVSPVDIIPELRALIARVELLRSCHEQILRTLAEIDTTIPRSEAPDGF